jgi:Holliday junction resolvase RusA-like endonuclease
MTGFTLDLPAPLSVNRTRRINWAASHKIARWKARADALVMCQGRLPECISGQFQVTVTLSEDSGLDADNTPKQIIDYLRRLKLIENDSPKHMRRVVIEFGEAPEGVRVTVQPMGSVA